MGGRGGGSSSSALGQARRQAAAAPAAASPADMVRQAFLNTVQPGQEWVRLPEIRTALARMGLLGRAEQDAAIAAFAVQRDTRVSPVANLKSLSDSDRTAAIRLGGELKHAITIERR